MGEIPIKEIDFIFEINHVRREEAGPNHIEQGKGYVSQVARG